MNKNRKVLQFLTVVAMVSSVWIPAMAQHLSNYQVSATVEEEQPLEEPTEMASEEESPRFSFTEEIKGHTGELFSLTFVSTKEVKEAALYLPKEATIVKGSLPEGITIEEGTEKNNWVLRSDEARAIFALPLVVEEEGSYDVSVEDAETTIDIEALEEELFEEELEHVIEQEEVLESEAVVPQEVSETEVTESLLAEFLGETTKVSTMAELRAAVSNPEVAIISVQANLTEATGTTIMRVDRPLLIQGNGHTLNFNSNGVYFLLAEVEEETTFRIENARVTKVGVLPLVTATVEVSSNWTFELEDITEVNANTMRLASLPEGKVVFTGGSSDFTRTTSTTTFIEAKEISAINQAQVTISRGNATILLSPVTVVAPKLTVENGSAITITTTAGEALTIDFRGPEPELNIQSMSQLTVTTIGTTVPPSNTRNNTISLVGKSPKITINEGSKLSTTSTAAKRGLHLAGSTPQVLVTNDSELSVTSATQAAVNLAGDNSLYSVKNSHNQLTSTSGVGIGLTGIAPTINYESSSGSIASTTGQRVNLIGATPILMVVNSQLELNATTGRGIYLQGTTPQVFLDDSQLAMTDTGASQGMILQGEDALLSLKNDSEMDIIGGGTGSTENIQIGNNNARPQLSVANGSKLSVTTPSGAGAASDTTNNSIHLRGIEPKVEFNDSEIKIDITSGARRGLYLNGNNPDLNILNSKVEMKTLANTNIRILGNNGVNQISKSNLNLSSGTSVALGFTGDAMKTHITDASKIVSNQGMYFSGEEVLIDNNSIIDITTITSTGVTTIISDQRSHYGVVTFERRGVNQGLVNVNNSSVSIEKKDGLVSSAPLNIVGGNNSLVAENGAKLNLLNEGSGTPSDSTASNSNAGIGFRSYGSDTALISNNEFVVRDPGSRINIDAKYGAAVTMSTNGTVFDGSVTVENQGYFSATGNTATNNSGVFVGRAVDIKFDNPLFLDFTNYRTGGGQVFGVGNASSTFIGLNSDLALWANGSDLTADPILNFKKLDYEFNGINYRNLVSTSDPEQLNTGTLGTTGLLPYTRISSNNGRWTIADELRVPTNADKKIHGRVSLPVGLDSSRPAWDDEAIATVEVETPDGDKQEYTAKTVGDSNESPGISIYGEEPRGGLFEIELDEPLEAGSKVRISKVELSSGELTDGFEHLILTDTVEVFPIVPPTLARFSSSVIAKDSTLIQGTSENPEVEVTATHNGDLLDIGNVVVDASGNFTINLDGVNLEEEDEIQIFLRDNEGNAEVAGVVDPPETNNDRGNINPAMKLLFRDVEFEPATILTVGDLGPVSPVDPLDPELEVDPDNKPEIPEEQGLLSIDFVSQFNFGSQGISVQDQTYYAQSQRLLNEDGTVNEQEERPNYVQVSDRRSATKRGGWQLAVTQNNQFIGDSGQELNGAQLRLSNQELATAHGGSPPSLQVNNPLALTPGSKRILVRAESEEGTGTWVYRFGNRDTSSSSVALEVPKGANPEAIQYTTTLNWELSAVPGN